MAKASKRPANIDVSAPLANAKHEAVAQAYISDRAKIGWRAYAAVYPSSSQRACETSFSDLLRKPEFAARVEWLARQAADGAVMTAREVLEGLSAIARGNLQDLAHLTVSDDVVGALQVLPREHAAAISELTVDSYNEGAAEGQEKQAHGGSLKRSKGREVKRVKLKLHDKRAALQDLGRHHKLFGQELQLGGDVIVEIKRFGAEKRSGQKAKPAA